MEHSIECTESSGTKNRNCLGCIEDLIPPMPKREAYLRGYNQGREEAIQDSINEIQIIRQLIIAGTATSLALSLNMLERNLLCLITRRPRGYD